MPTGRHDKNNRCKKHCEFIGIITITGVIGDNKRIAAVGS